MYAEPQQPERQKGAKQYKSPIHNDEEIMFGQGLERERSRTPPFLTYHSYPAPKDVLYPPYPQAQSYQAVTTVGEYDYMAPIPVTLPSMMHFHDSIKRESEDSTSPYKMNYEGLPPIDIHASYVYDNSNPHVCKVRAL